MVLSRDVNVNYNLEPQDCSLEIINCDLNDDTFIKLYYLETKNLNGNVTLERENKRQNSRIKKNEENSH